MESRRLMLLNREEVVSDQPYEDKIADVRGRLKRLDDLLADPHPGLMTWFKAYQDAVDKLLVFYSGWEGDK